MAASKDTRKAAAKKRASVKAAERTRRTISTPGKVTETGAGNIPANVARAAMTIAKHLSKSKSKPAAKPKSKPMTPAERSKMQAEMAKTRAAAKKKATQTAKARAEREAAGKAADKAQANRLRAQKVGYTGRKGTNAQYEGPKGSVRMKDERGNWGWR